MNDYSKYRRTALPFEEWTVPGPMTEPLFDDLCKFKTGVNRCICHSLPATRGRRKGKRTESLEIKILS